MPLFSRMVCTGSRQRLLLESQLSRKLSQNPPHAAFVQSRSPGNFHERQPLPLEFQDFVMSRRAKRQHLLPKIVGLRPFAGARLACRREFVRIGAGQRLFEPESRTMLADPIDKAVPSCLDEKGAQMGN